MTVAPVRTVALAREALSAARHGHRRARHPPSCGSSRNFTTSTPIRLATPVTIVAPKQAAKKERLVILGSGWGGKTLLNKLDRSRYEVVLVSPNTYFAMTPLLASAAVGTLDFRAAMEPVRSSGDLDFHHAWVDEIDLAKQTLKLMPAYPPSFRVMDPTVQTDDQKRTIKDAISAGAGVGVDGARRPHAVPPHSDPQKQQQASVGDEASAGASARIPHAKGGYATTFKKPAHRRDVEGVSEQHDGEAPAAHPLEQVADIAVAQEDGRHYTMHFDKLVIACGAYNRTFSTPGVKENAWFLKDAQNARSIRWRILETLEQASHPGLPDEDKRKLLSWVVVGGGPTGSELIGEIHDFVSKEIKRIFPALHPLIKLTLVDAADKILNSFDERLSAYAREKFVNDNIDLRLKRTIQRVEPGVLHIKEDGQLPFGLLVWSTGITSSPLIRSIRGIKKDKRSVSLLTDDQLRALKAEPGHELVEMAPAPQPGEKREKSREPVYQNVWALGDCAIINGRPMPATAQVAAAKAKHLAAILNGEMGAPDSAEAADTFEDERYFKHSSKGALTNLGSSRGIAEFPTGRITGRAAWLVWRGTYTWLSLSWRNRILVPFGWLMTTVFGRDVSRF